MRKSIEATNVTNNNAMNGKKENVTMQTEAIMQIEAAIGYEFRNKHLLVQAFTRASYRNEHPDVADNEVLEFYGDSVLSLAVSDILLERYSDWSRVWMHSYRTEKDLSSMRSALTNKRYLAECMGRLCLQEHLRVSSGDRKQGILNERSVLEDLFESLLGAVYLDSGKNWTLTREMVRKLLGVDRYLAENDTDVKISYKNSIQEWCQGRGYSLPIYTTVDDPSGFAAMCEIVELGVSARARGQNKKDAENNAAGLLLEKLASMTGCEKKASEAISPENAINKLQEYCQQKKMSLPSYEDVQDTLQIDNSHWFTVSCSLGTWKTYGEASRKTEAKKQAAFQMLCQLGKVNPQKVEWSGIDEDNPINWLQEYCQKNRFTLPEYSVLYDTVSADGSHLFTVRCIWQALWTEGDGKTAVEAKMHAAHNMIRRKGLI